MLSIAPQIRISGSNHPFPPITTLLSKIKCPPQGGHRSKGESFLSRDGIPQRQRRVSILGMFHFRYGKIVGLCAVDGVEA